MKSIFYPLYVGSRRLMWAIIVAFMLGVHNFYKGEDKSLDNIVKIELVGVQEDGAPKDQKASS